MRTNAASGRSFHEDFRPYIRAFLIAPNRAAWPINLIIFNYTPYFYSFKSTNCGAYKFYKRVASHENRNGGCKWSYNVKILCLTQVLVPVSHI
jgi:hypothetical protein